MLYIMLGDYSLYNNMLNQEEPLEWKEVVEGMDERCNGEWVPIYALIGDEV